MSLAYLAMGTGRLLRSTAVNPVGMGLRLRYLLICLSIACGLLAAGVAPSSAATLVAKVSLSTQTMTVIHHGKVKYQWQVSTARADKVTPTGSWTAKQLKRFHWSSRYGRAAMPYSIFYNGNFAVHGTNSVSKLGTPVSAGCIRLSRGHAATLFSMTKNAGLKNTLIVVEQ
jgi:lipoprotein-anchoring transpeptidase ErfK/SrfK